MKEDKPSHPLVQLTHPLALVEVTISAFNSISSPCCLCHCWLGVAIVVVVVVGLLLLKPQAVVHIDVVVDVVMTHIWLDVDIWFCLPTKAVDVVVILQVSS
jgi:hypothetical protein